MRCQKTGKVRHATKHAADIATRIAIETNADVTFNAYPCQGRGNCGGFHIGHMKRSMCRTIAAPRLIALIEMAVKS
jgi:hypothetical protein